MLETRQAPRTTNHTHTIIYLADTPRKIYRKIDMFIYVIRYTESILYIHIYVHLNINENTYKKFVQ